MRSDVDQNAHGKGASSRFAAFCLLRLFLLAALLAPPVHAEDLTAIISMKAQHAEHDHWEQWNPGLSLEQLFRTNGPLDVSLSAGSVRDSIGNWSPHAAFGLHRRVGDWAWGIRATVLYRHENLDGRKVGLKFVPLPSLDYVGETFGVGLVFIPRPSQDEQDSSALLLQLRMPL